MTALSPRHRALLRRALPCALVVAAVAVFDLRLHEAWRDEVNAMLTMREVPWSGLLGAMRYEGVPPLFHALLKLAGVVLPNPLALVAAGALGLSVLLFGTYRLLVAVSGAPRRSARATFVFSLTYAYAYELGVVIRQYALGLGLALLALAYLRGALRATADRRLVRAAALTAGLAALTSAHAACVAGAGLLGFGLLMVARRRPPRAFWPVLLTLPCFAYVLYLASPFPDRVGAGNALLHFSPEGTTRLRLQALVNGLMPFDWWRVETVVPPRLFAAFSLLRGLAFWSLLAAAAVGLAARARLLLSRWRVQAFDLAVLASWPPLLEIIVHHYWGFYRHHLFLGLPLVVIVLGWGLDARAAGALTQETRRTGLLLMAPWFALQMGLAAGSFALDAAFSFSDGKNASRMLAADAHVVADAEWRSVGLLFWRPDIHLRAPAWRGRPYRYIRPDAAWHQSVPVAPLVVEECATAPSRVYFTGDPGALGPLSACAHRIEFPRAWKGEHPLTAEAFDLFGIDCACVATPAPAKPPAR